MPGYSADITHMPILLSSFFLHPIVFKIFVILATIFILLFFSFFLLPETKRISRLILKKTILDAFIFPVVILSLLLVFYQIFKQEQETPKSPELFVFWEEYWKEFATISITYVIFFSFSLWKKSKRENINEHHHWADYVDTITKANEKFLALNVRDFNLFFEPLGVRYFYEQARILKTKLNITAKRIILIPGKSLNDPSFHNLLTRALLLNNNLNDNERTLYNIIQLHKIFNIELFFVPKTAITEMIPLRMENFLTKITKRIHLSFVLFLFKKLILSKKLDSLIIDNKFYHPTNKGQNLMFEEKKDKYNILIQKIFATYANDKNSSYYIDVIKENCQKTR